MMDHHEYQIFSDPELSRSEDQHIICLSGYTSNSRRLCIQYHVDGDRRMVNCDYRLYSRGWRCEWRRRIRIRLL
ncbi:hypothetical protein BJV74DRAFT_986187 [Russula compacta]|nr:hypothetical protein BJV74DRAFT_986187 [Russula compacta]